MVKCKAGVSALDVDTRLVVSSQEGAVPHGVLSKTLRSLRHNTRANFYGVECNTSSCSAPSGMHGTTMTDVWHRQQNTCQSVDFAGFTRLAD